MRNLQLVSGALGALLSLLLVGPPASADPILIVSQTSIALSPTQTVITIAVNPNGTQVAGVVVNLSALDPASRS